VRSGKEGGKRKRATFGEMADKTNRHRMRSKPVEGREEGRASVTMLHTEGKSRREELTRGWELRHNEELG
jgi:hypothetical protein